MTEEPETETENEKMKILLSFYPEFKITQKSDHVATMWLSNDYDLYIDVNANPGTWSAQRKRGNLKTDMMLRGGRVPEEDVKKADDLIKKYQEALVNWVMEVEQRAQVQDAIEVLRPPKRASSRTQAPAQDQAQPPEESKEEVQEKEDILPDEPDLEALAVEDQEGEESNGADPEEVLPEWDEKKQELRKKVEDIANDITNRRLALMGQPLQLQSQGTEPENEIKITRNSKGYSWVITARAANLDTAFINAIRVNEDLEKVLISQTE